MKHTEHNIRIWQKICVRTTKCKLYCFYGTPLLGAKRLTNQWFGNYVSEYNFAQSVEEGSTVPLFYSRRVPTVELENNYLDDEVLDIIEDENLTEEEAKKVENSASKVLEVIKREDRLDKIAQDIAHHFPRRGFLGKAMVVSVDKFTTVKMYDKVQHYWQIEIQNLVKERNQAKTKEDRDDLTNRINYMRNVEMAVVISDTNADEERFTKQGLDISKHKAKMAEISPEGLDLEDRFKTPHDPLSLVFVCAMWLTGFDVKNLSTLYLDKPMKSHTLMQAIARANRVYPGKPCGIIVDYVNVFKYMKQALSDYGSGNDDDDYPAKDIESLKTMIDDSVKEGEEFLSSIGIDLNEMMAEKGTFNKSSAILNAYNTIIATDDGKEKFKVITNTMCNLYEASKPEIFEQHWRNPKFAPLKYIHDLFDNSIRDDRVEEAKQRISDVLDGSISSSDVEENSDIVIHEGKVIDLSKLDVDDLKRKLNMHLIKLLKLMT